MPDSPRASAPDRRPIYGPELWLVCAACNYEKHICHFCGDSLRHDERLPNGDPNPCYQEALVG